MGEFFFEYGLFAAKVITLIIVILLAVMVFALMIASRQRETEAIEIEKINDKFDSMREALEDEILSKEEIKLRKKDRKKKEKEEARALKKRFKKGTKEAKKEKEDGEKEETRPRIFLLRFTGDLHASEVENLREAITAVLTVAKPEQDEVLVIIDSPGGLVHSYGLAASQLTRIRQKQIKLTAAVDYVAASGGYLMAAVADKIIAAPFAIVGSIGVLAQIPNFHRLLEKHNIDIEQHTAGEYKTTLTVLGKNTDKARNKFREELEDTHVLFKQFVSEYRPALDIEKLATGEHWYGNEALRLNLVDEIMTSDDFLLKSSETTDIYEVNYVIHESLSDKISNIVHGFSSRLVNKFWTFCQRIKY